jgi:hypothetical protein
MDMAKRKFTPRHEVKIGLRNLLELTYAGSALSVHVTDRGQRLGVIEVGQGSIIWWGRNKRTGKRIGWNKLAEILDGAPGRSIKVAR